MSERRIAFCGNDCAACPRLLATRSGDRVRLVEAAALWHRLGFRDSVVAPEEIACDGCSPAHPCRHGIAACAGERRVGHCGDCAERPGCDRLATALERTERYAEECRTRCDAQTFEALRVAFFLKRANLG